MKMNVASVQCSSVPGNPEATLKQALQWMDQATSRDVKLLVFPEAYYPGLKTLADLKANPKRREELFALFDQEAEPIPGPATRTIGEAAKQYRMHVVLGMTEKSVSDTYYNASVLIGPSGEVLNVHHKTILTPGVETPEFTPGDVFTVTRTEIGNIGQLICAESSCPESARILAIKGANIICHSTGLFSHVRAGVDLGELMMEHSHVSKSRAVDNSVFWIHANLSGQVGKYEFFGKSRIYDFLGNTLAMGRKGTAHEELLVAEIDLEKVADLPIRLMDRRRPEIYQEILLPNEGREKLYAEIKL